VSDAQNLLELGWRVESGITLTPIELREVVGIIMRNKNVEIKVMNALQQRGIISDNCITARDVPLADLYAAVESLATGQPELFR